MITLEGSDGLLEVNESTRDTREDFRHEERLRKELLDLSSSCDDELIFFGEIINTKNGNDILEGFIILEDLLDTSCNIVMLLTNGDGVKHSGS